MPVRVRYYTDPACPVSWAAEPQLRKLMVEFGAELAFTYVMGGLARSYEPPHWPLVGGWLEAADRSGMPVDPLLWWQGPLQSSHPACMAVKAAAEQGSEAEERCLRALREGLFCRRRKLDSAEALVEEAREAGLDARRFRIDLQSHAIVEAFSADLEAARALPGAAKAFEAGARPPATAGGDARLPVLQLTGDDGEARWLAGTEPYEEWRAAALAVGARPAAGPPPDVLAALGRFGHMASAEVAAVCDLPGPRAAAELWRLACEWRVRPLRVLNAELWELA